MYEVLNDLKFGRAFCDDRVLAKIVVSGLNNRLSIWVGENGEMNEFQARLRKSYSTVDTFCLDSLVRYEYTVDVQKFTVSLLINASLNRVNMDAMLYKLCQMGAVQVCWYYQNVVWKDCVRFSTDRNFRVGLSSVLGTSRDVYWVRFCLLCFWMICMNG